MAHVKNHDFHILQPSAWPLKASIAAFLMLFGAVVWMKDMTVLGLIVGGAGNGIELSGPWLFWIGFIAVLYTMWGWWSETIVEDHEGDHTPVVVIGLRYGFILFIMSEVMFFAAWFWSAFKHFIYPMQNYVGTEYVQPKIYAVDAFHLPLINTLILLLSGCAVTWAHHALAHGGNDRKGLVQGLAIGIAFGVVFTGLQAFEYYELIAHKGWEFGNDIFYSNFFMATGFHGFHVIVGTIFLFICLQRSINGDFLPQRHVGFEAAAWYWHFVDVVWLFLFFAVYVWGVGVVTH